VKGETKGDPTKFLEKLTPLLTIWVTLNNASDYRANGLTDYRY